MIQPTINLNYADFVEIEETDYFHALRRFDENGDPEYQAEEHAWPVLFESIKGRFFANVFIDESLDGQGQWSVCQIYEVLTGAQVGKGFTFAEAYRSAIENFHKPDALDSWNDLVAKLGDNVSPCYRRKETKP